MIFITIIQGTFKFAMTKSWSSCEGALRYAAVTPTGASLPDNGVAAEYPQHTLTATPTCSSLPQ